MLFIIESVILCVLFSIGIFVPLAKNPVGQIMSYPVEIRKRVESLPQYRENIKKKEKRHIYIKVIGVFGFALILALVAYFSGATTLKEVFLYVFCLFFVVNMYDLFVMDIGIFMHCKKFWIPGTEDMIKEYHNPRHHIIGALKGCLIGSVVSLISTFLVFVIGLLI